MPELASILKKRSNENKEGAPVKKAPS